ncbi:MAG TPA: GNAT family N-acetyltransferase [Acidimicrobiales bacterium]|jgi:RimJ/RimL family protein N-acetyltransferase|nr:GNAT family N-acetyltransferase [Acidimicrobiales bacterium]
MTFGPIFTTRLTLRPPTVSDAEATWRYRRLPEVSEWLTRGPGTLEDHTAWFCSPASLEKTLIIELDNQIIGDLMLDVQDAWAQTEVAAAAHRVQAELGWALAPAHTGHGYATEAVRAAIDLCFGDLRLRRITASCFVDNERSWRLMERVGMRREGHLIAESLHRSGHWLDSFTYALRRDEWSGQETYR